jgi:acetate kinase
VAAVSDRSALIFVVNSGSSSVKFGVFARHGEQESAILKGEADGIGRAEARLQISDASGKSLLDESHALPTQGEALSKIVEAVRKFAPSTPVAVGHRVVHGGPHLRQHQPITADLVRKLEAAVHFAPLHIPNAVALIRQTEKSLPGVRQFACFDTAFHVTIPETASRFALPEELYKKGVQRYGFHGLSYESIVHRLGDRIPARVVCAHLGNGSSLAALRDGRSVDTSMGLTPTGGVPMATRSGDLDPGVLLFLMRTESMTADALEQLLNRQSGLAAISGGESDMRKLQSNAANGDRNAALAIDIFTTAVRKYIGAYAAELGGLDLLVFTGGIGEHSRYVRERICEGLGFLDIEKMPSGEMTKVAVMESEEEIQIARHCRRFLVSS